MTRLRGSGYLIIATLVLLCSACSPPGGLERDSSAQADQHQVPFRGGTPPASGSDSANAQENSPKSQSELPFRDAKNLPAGTLLTVRLKNTVSAEDPNPNGTFDAVLDQPVMVDGDQLVEPGAVVSGRVEAARASNLGRNSGYVRLTLDVLEFDGGQIPLQTSSLFVRGTALVDRAAAHSRVLPDGSNAVVRIEKGRRLVFRLTETVYLATSQRPPTAH